MDKLRLIMDCDCTMGVPGCDVDDPSARVLKNYGDSGK